MQKGAENTNTTKNTKRWCKCFDTFHKKWNQDEGETWTIKISTTSSQRSHASRDSLHPRLRPRPSSSFASTATLALRSLSTTESWPSQAAKCSGVEPREPRPSRRQNPTERRGKNSEKLGATYKSKFWKFWPLKLPWTWFWDVLKSSTWLKYMLPLVFYWSHVSHVSQNDLDKLKHTRTLENNSAHDWDTIYFENNLPSHWLV